MEIVVTAFWIVFAIGFYRVRCWNRLVYGLIELAAGIAVIILGEFPPNTMLTAADNAWPLGSRAAHMLTLMGGVYRGARPRQHRSGIAVALAKRLAPGVRYVTPRDAQLG